jgi:hypothetical protein
MDNVEVVVVVMVMMVFGLVRVLGGGEVSIKEFNFSCGFDCFGFYI